MSLFLVHVAASLPELGAVLDLAGRSASLIYHAERPWKSASFSGARHTIQLRFEGVDAVGEAELFVQRLEKHVFVLAGRNVVDTAIIQIDRFAGCPEFGPVTTVVLEVLALQEDC